MSWVPSGRKARSYMLCHWELCYLFFVIHKNKKKHYLFFSPLLDFIFVVYFIDPSWNCSHDGRQNISNRKKQTPQAAQNHCENALFDSRIRRSSSEFIYSWDFLICIKFCETIESFRLLYQAAVVTKLVYKYVKSFKQIRYKFT